MPTSGSAGSRPPSEVDLCGHATLASAHCLFEDGIAGPDSVRDPQRRPHGRAATGRLARDGLSGLAVRRGRGVGSAVADALGAPVEWTGRTTNGAFLLALMGDEDVGPRAEPGPRCGERARLLGRPDPDRPAADPGRGYDFVSRVFAPQAGIPEDPVTGSAHTVLAPYWADRLGRTSLSGFQVSRRSGFVGVELNGDRVTITGRAVTVFDGALSEAADRAIRSGCHQPKWKRHLQL